MQQEPPGVVVPAALCAAVARLAVVGLDVLSRRDGGLRPVPGLPALLRELSMADTGHAFATIGETRWVDVAEAARLAGVSERSARRLAANGRLIARRHGLRSWQIEASSAREYGRR
jgi:hypothetical protein